MKEYVLGEIKKTQKTVDAVIKDKKLIETVIEIAQKGSDVLRKGGKIIFAGNGGSAADSQHLAAEIVSRLNYDRPALPAIAITTDTSALTAIGNDYGYEHVFSRQLEAIGNKKDLFFAISTSGNSPNILKALNSARKKGITSVGLTGKSGGKMAGLCDYVIKIPSTETPKIQECHIMLGHIICSLIEEEIHGAKYNPKRKR